MKSILGITVCVVCIGAMNLSTAQSEERPLGRLFGLNGVAIHDGHVVEKGTEQLVCSGLPGGSPHLRLRLQIGDHKTDTNWNVTVSNPERSAVQLIHGNRLAEGIWTVAIDADCAYVKVPADGASIIVTHRLRVEPQAAPKSWFPLYKTIPSYESPWGHRITEINQAASSMALLEFVTKDRYGQDKESTCTGFLISQRWLITNYHCISTEAAAESLIVRIGFKGYLEGQRQRVDGARLAIWSEILDYSILELSDAYRDNFIPLVWGHKVSLSDSLAILQHPSGSALQLSFQLQAEDECWVRSIRIAGAKSAHSDFGHRCDTDGGSSGSMVIRDVKGCRTIVGLHHWGMDDTSEAEPQNQAVHVDAIYEDIRQKANGGDANSQLVLSYIVFAPNKNC